MRAQKTVSILSSVLSDAAIVAVNGRWAHVNDNTSAYFLDCRTVTDSVLDALRHDLGSDDPEVRTSAYTNFCQSTAARHEGQVPARVRAVARFEGCARRDGALTWGW